MTTDQLVSTLAGIGVGAVTLAVVGFVPIGFGLLAPAGVEVCRE